MGYQLYLHPFLLAFIISVILNWFLIWLSPKKESRKSARHIHSKAISRYGGVAIFIGFLIAIIFNPNLIISEPLKTILTASFFVIVFGVWDDFRELEWKKQLAFQLAIAITIFMLGVRVDYIGSPLGGIIQFGILTSFIFGVLWILIFINSMNWLDGIDGLSGGVAIIAALTMFLLSLKPEVNQPPVGIITIALAGSILGFLIFNFNPAKILAGTSGSMFMGFILAGLAIFAGTKIATALLVMAIPVADFIWVIIKRKRDGASIFKSDQRHLHHKLMELGWSQRKICLFFYILTFLFAIVALNTDVIGKLMAISLVFILILSIIYIVNNRVRTHVRT